MGQEQSNFVSMYLPPVKADSQQPAANGTPISDEAPAVRNEVPSEIPDGVTRRQLVSNIMAPVVESADGHLTILSPGPYLHLIQNLCKLAVEIPGLSHSQIVGAVRRGLSNADTSIHLDYGYDLVEPIHGDFCDIYTSMEILAHGINRCKSKLGKEIEDRRRAARRTVALGETVEMAATDSDSDSDESPRRRPRSREPREPREVDDEGSSSTTPSTTSDASATSQVPTSPTSVSQVSQRDLLTIIETVTQDSRFRQQHPLICQITDSFCSARKARETEEVGKATATTATTVDPAPSASTPQGSEFDVGNFVQTTLVTKEVLDGNPILCDFLKKLGLVGKAEETSTTPSAAATVTPVATPSTHAVHGGKTKLIDHPNLYLTIDNDRFRQDCPLGYQWLDRLGLITKPQPGPVSTPAPTTPASTSTSATTAASTTATASKCPFASLSPLIPLFTSSTGPATTESKCPLSGCPIMALFTTGSKKEASTPARSRCPILAMLTPAPTVNSDEATTSPASRCPILNMFTSSSKSKIESKKTAQSMAPSVGTTTATVNSTVTIKPDGTWEWTGQPEVRTSQVTQSKVKVQSRPTVVSTAGASGTTSDPLSSFVELCTNTDANSFTLDNCLKAFNLGGEIATKYDKPVDAFLTRLFSSSGKSKQDVQSEQPKVDIKGKQPAESSGSSSESSSEHTGGSSSESSSEPTTESTTKLADRVINVCTEIGEKYKKPAGNLTSQVIHICKQLIKDPNQSLTTQLQEEPQLASEIASTFTNAVSLGGVIGTELSARFGSKKASKSSDIPPNESSNESSGEPTGESSSQPSGQSSSQSNINEFREEGLKFIGSVVNGGGVATDAIEKIKTELNNGKYDEEIAAIQQSTGLGRDKIIEMCNNGGNMVQQLTDMFQNIAGATNGVGPRFDAAKTPEERQQVWSEAVTKLTPGIKSFMRNVVATSGNNVSASNVVPVVHDADHKGKGPSDAPNVDQVEVQGEQGGEQKDKAEKDKVDPNADIGAALGSIAQDIFNGISAKVQSDPNSLGLTSPRLDGISEIMQGMGSVVNDLFSGKLNTQVGVDDVTGKMLDIAANAGGKLFAARVPISVSNTVPEVPEQLSAEPETNVESVDTGVYDMSDVLALMEHSLSTPDTPSEVTEEQPEAVEPQIEDISVEPVD